MRALALVLVVIAMAGEARAQSISFGSAQDVYVGNKSGLFVSHDAGTTWHWMCPAAVSYSGNYTPDFQGSSTSVFAATFDGAKVMRDGCTFNALSTGHTFVSQIERASNGDIWLAASDPGDSKIYKSVDDGVTFPTSFIVGMNGDWWESLVVSSDTTPWESGYRIESNNTKTHLLAHGASPLATTAFTTSAYSTVQVVGVHEMDIYVRVTFEDGVASASLYHSNDLVTWQKIATELTSFSFLLRKDGSILVATPTSFASSTDQGATWTPVTCAPTGITCLAESPTGEVWACTSESTVVRTANLTTWTYALNPHDVAGPATCGAGTVQHDTCEPQWATVDAQLDAIALTAPPVCVAADDAPAIPGDTTPVTDPSPGGCCSGSAHPSDGALVTLLSLALSRRRRPRRRDPSR